MILTLLGIVLIVIGFIIMHVYFNKYNLSDNMDNILCAFGAFGIVLGGLITIICIIIIISSHVHVDKKIHNDNLEYESIVKQVECINSDYEDYSNIEVINRVYKWNNRVYNTKYWSENVLTNWFYSKKYVESLKYIELEN